MNFQTGMIVADQSSDAVTEEIRAILAGLAQSRQTITYSELVRRITSKRLKPRDEELNRALEEISRDEDGRGRGMLSVVVVGKTTGLPGFGFFHLARTLGRNTSDRGGFWEAEFNFVCEACSR